MSCGFFPDDKAMFKADVAVVGAACDEGHGDVSDIEKVAF